MRLFGLLLLRHYRLRLGTELKRLALATSLVAGVFFLIAMWPAFEAGHRSTYENAHYDIMLNGALSEADLAAISSVLGPDQDRQVRMNVGFAEKITAHDSRKATRAAVFRYEPDDIGRIDLSFFNPGVLISGRMSAPDDWGIDYSTARTLGVGLGDRVAFVQTVVGPDDSASTLRNTGTIRAVYQPSTVLSGLLVPFDPDDQKVFSRTGASMTHVFIQLTGDTNAAINRLRAHPRASNWYVETLSQHRAGAEEAISMGAGDSRSLTSGILVAGGLAYAVYSLIDEHRRFAARSKSLAITSSLGAGWRIQVGALALEQAAFAAVSCGLGVWIGSQLLWQVMRTFVPADMYASAAIAALLTNLMVIASTAGAAVWRLMRLPIARLLTSE